MYYQQVSRLEQRVFCLKIALGTHSRCSAQQQIEREKERERERERERELSAMLSDPPSLGSKYIKRAKYTQWHLFVPPKMLDQAKEFLTSYKKPQRGPSGLRPRDDTSLVFP